MSDVAATPMPTPPAPGQSGAAPLRVERHDDGVVVLTLAVPERRNAMTEALTAAWARTIAELQADRSVRAVVVTGEGTAFCAGGDLSWMEADAGQPQVMAYRDKMQTFYDAWLGVRDLEVPVLAAVNGPAVGAGLCLTLACDLRWAAPAARFSAPFTFLGMHPGMGATYLIPEAVGVVRARELLYAGAVVHAEQAQEWGLVSGVLPAETLVAEVTDVAHRIATSGPIAVRLTKAGLAQAHASLSAAIAWEALAQPVTMGSADMAEGVRAQQERRRPVFTGR